MKNFIIKYLRKIIDKWSNNHRYCRDVYGNLYEVEDIDENYISIKRIDPKN